MLTFTHIHIPGADIGPENSLPPLPGPQREENPTSINTTGVPEEIKQNMSRGRLPCTLPYTTQDGYTRDKYDKKFLAAILENDALKATFLLECGGRLSSLYDKKRNRHLVQNNPVFQPANLAIRNAWFSGGVEWNVGVKGHCPFTCSPIFAARVEADDGTEILRMYEWERIRGTPFQIDAWLPEEEEVLFIRPRILNPHPKPIPMYWWSNIAVPETESTRVIVPADQAFGFGYTEGGLKRMPFPAKGEIDSSYPTNLNRSMDFFFDIPKGNRHWIASVDEEGIGFAQTSTSRLKGRKLFLWGQGPGAKTWQKYLAKPGHAYIEIQAGLAHTQSEYLLMPAHTEWDWLETYGAIEADPSIVHSNHWQSACNEVKQKLESTRPRDQTEQTFLKSTQWKDTPPDELIQEGSGWGALERRRKVYSGDPSSNNPAVPFPDSSLGAAQQIWLELLEGGCLRAPASITDMPPSYMVQEEWVEILHRSLAHSSGDHWFSQLHLGIMRHYQGATEEAAKAWHQSTRHTVNPWALRNLAHLERIGQNAAKAAQFLLQASSLHPSCYPLTIECADALLQAGNPGHCLSVIRSLSEALRNRGRPLIYETKALIGLNRLDEAENILTGKLVVDDIREGEGVLSETWFELHEKRMSQGENRPINDDLRAEVRRKHPLPPALDFRMVVKDSEESLIV